MHLRAVAGAILAAFLLGASAAAAQSEPRRPARTSAADTAAFYTWWLRGASTDVGPGGDTALVAMPAGVASTAIGLVGLRPPTPPRVTRPAELEGEEWLPLELLARGDETLLLWLPTDTAGLADDSGCGRHRARLGVGPRGEWTPIRLNPYCDETYGILEADVIFYWLDGDEWPHIEIVTNGPACVPAELYRFDARTRRYAMVRSACGG